MTDFTISDPGILSALQSLRRVDRDLDTTMKRVTTGKRVADPADNPAAWAIAEGLRSDIATWGAVKEGLGFAKGATAVAAAATTMLHDNLTDMRAQIVKALNGEVDTATVNALLTTTAKEMDSTVRSANYNGTNLVYGAKDMSLMGNIQGDSVTVKGFDLTTDSLGITGLTVSTDSLHAIDQALQQVNIATSWVALGQNTLETREKFSQGMIDVLTEGVGNMVDADMAEESGRLASLQVRKQLAIQVLSIANQQASWVLRLFS